MRLLAPLLALALCFASTAGAGVLGTRGAASVKAFGFGAAAGPPPVVGPGFDPALTSGAINLTNSNRTATISTSGSFEAAFVNTPVTGAAYFEIQLNSSITGSINFGLAVAGTATSGVQLGAAANTMSYNPFDGSVGANSALIGTAAVAGSGDVIRFAINRNTNLMWVAVNGGNWNNSGTANPSTGVGGFSITALTGTQRPGLSFNTASRQATIATGGLSRAFPVPSGYSVLVGGN
jgi:hypothetical protein